MSMLSECKRKMQAQQNFVLKLTLSSNESVAFKAPSGRPKGKQYLKKK